VAFFQDWSNQQIGGNRLQYRYNDNSFSKVYVVEDFHKHHQTAITIVKVPLTVSVIIPFSSSTITSAGVPTSNVPVMPTTVFRSAQHKRVLNKYMFFPFILGLLVAFSGCGLFPFGSSVQRTPTFSPTQAIAATATIAAQAYATGTARQGVMLGFDAAHTNDNSYEHTIGPGNISQLTPLWSWSFATGAGGPSPVVAGNVIYASSYATPSITGKLYAFDATCRKACQPLWSFAIGDYSSAPAVAYGIVYISSYTNDRLYAFDATCRKACQPLWSFATAGEITVAGGMVYIGTAGKLYAFDATCHEACQPLWSFATAGVGESYDSPTVAGGMVYIGMVSKLYAFDATCREACQPLWSFAIGQSSLSSSAVVGGMIYIATPDWTSTGEGGKLYAFDATCRKACQPLWSFAIGDRRTSLPAIANGMVYIGSDDYKLYAFDVTCRKNCQPLWSFATAGEIYGSPIIAGSVVYIFSEDNQLYAFDATCRKACQPLWSFDVGEASFSVPTIANGVVYFNSDKLYALGLVTK
jgi:outer membrane protein assembly factor BamB